MSSGVVFQGGFIGYQSADDDKGRKLMDLYRHMEHLRSPWQLLYEEALAYMAPEYGDWTLTDLDDGRKQTRDIFNTKPLTYVQTVSAGFQGYLTPQAGKWVMYETENRALMEQPGVRRYLQESQEHMDSVLRVNGFYQTLAETYPQLIVAGTGTGLGQEDEEDGMLKWTSVHPKHVFISQDYKGDISSWALEFPFAVSEIISQYGRDKVPESYLRMAEKNPFDTVPVVVFIMPRSVRDITKTDQLNKPWATYHVLKNDAKVLREGGMDSPAAVTGRWTRTSNEVYGRGWGLRVLSDVLRLNAMTKADLIAYQWHAQPAVGFPPEMREEFELVPGAKIPLFGSKQLQLLNPGGNPGLGREAVMMLEQNIAEQLMVTFFLSLLQQQGTRTATEVLELAGEKAAILGTMVDRPMRELVVPMLARTWESEARHGRLPVPPRAIVQNRATIKLNFVGPLAQIAKRFHAHQTVSQTLATFVPLVEMSQGDVLKIINWNELGRYVLNEGNFPQVAVRDRDEVRRLSEMEAQARQQQQQLQQLEIAGKAAPGIAKLQGVGATGVG